MYIINGEGPQINNRGEKGKKLIPFYQLNLFMVTWVPEEEHWDELWSREYDKVKEFLSHLLFDNLLNELYHFSFQYQPDLLCYHHPHPKKNSDRIRRNGSLLLVDCKHLKGQLLLHCHHQHQKWKTFITSRLNTSPAFL